MKREGGDPRCHGERRPKGKVRLPGWRRKTHRLFESSIETALTEPPPRYRSNVVKALEENGISRPSTYQRSRRYDSGAWLCDARDRRFRPTDIGIAVNDLLMSISEHR